MMALLLGTTACPGDDAPAMDTGDSTTGDTTTGDTTTSVTVTVTVTDTDSVTETVDSTDGTIGDTTTGGPTCGDDTAEGDEQCDGTDLTGESCVSQGFDGGRLACADDCTFETSGCTSGPVCGNDTIDGKDVCDGTDVGSEDCGSQGFDGGTLGCLADCTGYDTSMCMSATCVDEDIGMNTGGGVSMGNLDADDDDLEPSCGGMGGLDHVVLFTAPADDTWIFDTLGSDFDTKLALFTACDDATEVGCNDDTVDVTSEVQLDMTAGQTIYVVIDGFDGETGNYILNINPAPVCGEDEDIGMNTGDGVSMGNLDVDDDDLDPSCGGTGGLDHVVLFTAPADDTWIFDTLGSDFDTKLALFTACDNATEIDCDDDTVGVTSEVQLDMTAGQTIYVVIDGFDGGIGNYILNINPAPVCGDGAVTGNELCDGADVGGATCADAGLGGAGAITCAVDCAALDASACNPPTGFGNCGSFPEAQVCTAEEVCGSDGGGNAVCVEIDCANVGECGPAPATGNSPVTCADSNGDGFNDCYLSCEAGETCPDGMDCFFGLICLWTPLP